MSAESRDFTYAELAGMTGVDVRTIGRLVRSGELDAIRVNRKVILVPLSSWQAYRERKLAEHRAKFVPQTTSSASNDIILSRREQPTAPDS